MDALAAAVVALLAAVCIAQDAAAEGFLQSLYAPQQKSDKALDIAAEGGALVRHAQPHDRDRTLHAPGEKQESVVALDLAKTPAGSRTADIHWEGRASSLVAIRSRKD